MMLTWQESLRIWIPAMLLDIGLWLLNFAFFLHQTDWTRWANFGALIFIAILFGFAIGRVFPHR